MQLMILVMTRHRNEKRKKDGNTGDDNGDDAEADRLQVIYLIKLRIRAQ